MLAVALGACDGTAPVHVFGLQADAAAPPDAALTWQEELTHAIASAVCEKVDLCCPGMERSRVLGVGEDRAACVLTLGAFYGRQYGGVGAAVDGQHAYFDRAALQPCLDAYREAGCEAPGFRARAQCVQVLRGLVMDGQGCASGFECSSRLCPARAEGTPRTCSPRRADGQSCSRDGECQSGLCRTSLLSGTCAARPLSGGACGGEGFWLTL